MVNFGTDQFDINKKMLRLVGDDLLLQLRFSNPDGTPFSGVGFNLVSNDRNKLVVMDEDDTLGVAI